MNYQDNLSRADERALILYPSRQKVLLLFIVSLILVAASIFILPRSSGSFEISFAILAIIVFSLCMLAYIFMLVKPFPVLQLSDEGFHYRSFFGRYFIPWGEIAFIFLSKARLSSSLNIYLSKTGLETFSARYRWRGRICRLFGGPGVAIPFVTLPLPAQQVLETIQERYQQQITHYNIYVR